MGSMWQKVIREMKDQIHWFVQSNQDLLLREFVYENPAATNFCFS